MRSHDIKGMTINRMRDRYRKDEEVEEAYRKSDKKKVGSRDEDVRTDEKDCRMREI